MRKVVIVDDEYIVVKGIQAMIAREKMEFEVVGYALNGVDGLAVILEEKPDLVISDIRMPGMDGLSLIETAKEECPNTVFVIISGYQEFEYARRALMLGVKGYIDKPITIAKVRETLIMADEVLKKNEENSGQYKKIYQEACTALTDLIISKQTKGYEEILEATFAAMKGNVHSLDEYKEESYKLLCMAFGIFYEQRQERKEEQHFPSYKNIEVLKGWEEVDLVSRELFQSLFGSFIRKLWGVCIEQLKCFWNT